MANQAELEPGMEPEWDTKSVVDAGTREGTMVRQLSYQEILEQQEIEASSTSPILNPYEEATQQLDTNTTGYMTRGTGDIDSDRYVAARIGAMDSVLQNEDPYDAVSRNFDNVQQSLDVNGDVYMRMSHEAREVVKGALSTLAGQPGQDSAVAQLALQELQSVLEQTDKPWGFEYLSSLVLNGLAGLQTAKGNDLLRESVYIDYASSIADSRWSQFSFGQKATDALQWFLPGSAPTTTALGGYLDGYTPGAVGAVFNTLGEVVSLGSRWSITGEGFDAYLQTYDKFWDAPVNERMLAFSEIEAHIKDITQSDSFSYLSLIQPFIEKAAIKDLKIDYGLDTGGLAVIAPATALVKMGKFAAKIAKARKPISILKNTGNVEKAATMLNRALADSIKERAKKVTGMDTTSLASSANALDMTAVVPEQIDGIALEAARQLEKEVLERTSTVDEAFTGLIDPKQTPQRFYYDKAAQMARQREVLGAENDYPNMARIVESDDTGFVVEVTRGSKYEGAYDVESLQAANQILRQNITDAQEGADSVLRGIQSQLALDEANLQNAEQAMRVAPRKGGVERRTTQDIESRADELFGTDEEANVFRKQISDYKAQIKRNEAIIKDLQKPPKTTTDRVNYTFNEQGQLKATSIGRGTVTWLNSPTQTVDQLMDQVGDATLIEMTEAKALKALNDATYRITRGLTKEDHQSVDALLLHGDELGRELTTSELINGVQTKGGLIQLRSTNAIAAYHAQRRRADWLWVVQNQLRRRNLENGGFRELNTKLRGADGSVVKVFAKDTAERKSIPAGVRRLYNHKTGRVEDVTQDTLKQLDGDWSVVQFRSGYRMDDEVIEYGLVRSDKDLKPISGQVLRYAKGYVPRVRPNVLYVASHNVKRLVNGVKQDASETVRFFRSREEGEAWRLSQPNHAEISILPDKEYKAQNPNFEDDFDGLSFGGLYNGERTDRSILMGVDGEEAHRASAYYALQMYTDHVANRVASNELKMNLIGRFQNTFGQYLQNPANWQSELNTAARNDTALRNTIETQRKFIRDMIRMPDSWQMWWSDRMRSLAELMEPVPFLKGKPREWAMSFTSRDPTAFMRATTFHLFLGAFNPAQVLIQGFGAATAIAAYPTKAPKLMAKQLGLSYAWLAKDPAQIRKVAESVGMDGDELVDIVGEIKRAGLFDSLTTNADFQAAVNGVSLTADAVRNTLHAGTLPLRMGEQISRGYGYLLARDNFIQAKRAKSKNWFKTVKLSDADKDQIVKDSFKFTLNLGRSNRAAWQKGPVSVPTQFLQVMGKFLENMVAGSFDGSWTGAKRKGLGVRQWTPAEKAKVAIGYLGMFGVAGVGLDSLVTGAVNAYRSRSQDNSPVSIDRVNPFDGATMSDEEFARWYRSGLVGMLTHWITGADASVSNRLSIPAGLEETLHMLNSDDRTATEVLGGATWSGGSRIFQAIKGLWDIYNPTNPAIWSTLSDEELRQAGREVAQILASTRNFDKAYWWHKSRQITNASGRPILSDKDEEEFAALLGWQVAGFQPLQVKEVYALKDAVGKAPPPKEMGGYSERINDAKQRAVKMLLRYPISDKNAIDRERKRIQIAARWAFIVSDLSEAEKAAVWDQVVETLKNDGPMQIEAVQQAVEAEERADGRLMPGMLGNSLLVPQTQE